MDAAKLEKGALFQFPTVMGGIVPVVNIPGVSANALRLTGDVLADIYAGTISSWNDPKITALNPGLKLPDLPIATVHRADGSGTTFVFTSYLSRIAVLARDGRCRQFHRLAGWCGRPWQ
jgi:phosphate transport system substrate-binding protein